MAQDDAKQQAQNLQLRTALSDAYASVQGAKAVQSYSALTFEDLCNQQIQRISGPDTSSRPNALNRVQQVLNNVVQAVAQIKSLPDTAFNAPNEDNDVNTPVTVIG